jgi:hypothetical protein
MASLKDLYAEYGRLMVQIEILNSQVLTIKRQIAEELNKPPTPQEEKKNES